MLQRLNELQFIGMITTGIGLLCFLLIPADPRHTRMFNEEERALALARLDADQMVQTHGRKEGTSLKLVLRAFNFNVCTPQSYSVQADVHVTRPLSVH